MNLVIDCNVFISVCLGSDTCRAAVEHAHVNHQVCCSLATLQELESTLLKQKFQKAWFQENALHLLAMHKRYGRVITPVALGFSMPDPKDEIYLATAMAGQADAIITGNLKHFPPLLCGPVRILSPRQYLTETRHDCSR
ncbi:MAG: putative toxin-antitoxin system toxin component, PIN family [Magnetococcales bacterium]|nr:putative toxin-antitoxin system toxin component, PIN family [Magnetococcales bacterium]NGZ25506.1 putative toxin-antitoxin system toxin component, PIN family [Magnetococcales bacterium]